MIQLVTHNRFIIAVLETLSIKLPEYFFTFLPTGSLREGFGKKIPSSSVLATDYDMMLIPDAVGVGQSFIHKSFHRYLHVVYIIIEGWMSNDPLFCIFSGIFERNFAKKLCSSFNISIFYFSC